MASKPPPATRASSRIKQAPAFVPLTTRTTRRTATAASKPVSESSGATTNPKKAPVRKPLVNRENSVENVAKMKHPARKTAADQPSLIATNEQREPIMAYLRIRPRLGDDESIVDPYLVPLTDTAVRMTDPNEQENKSARFRPSALPSSSTYTFSHIFPPDTTQSDFFAKTTLPLVRDVLQGQNGLLFTYGVTNSGKTYTVQGGTSTGSAGILPRTLDVIFNSIEGLHGDGKFRPVRLQGAEPAEPNDLKPPQVILEPALTAVLGQQVDISTNIADVDTTVIKVDRNYEYTIWISYAEVYNEKVYDLLESVKNDSAHNTGSGITNASTSKNLVLTRAALSLKPSPASDNGGSATAGKYISGLRQFRVENASQAKALVKLGQLHRRVFGTLANSESSRSHGLVFIKVVKVHRGERDDPTALQISRLTLVDLAGSERTKHTHTTGDRLREAGNINKSLMVLGQCMEVMRSNQRKLAMSLAQDVASRGGRMDTRDVKQTFAIVPFRHSKLTETLMDYFVGNGKAVMIVNVNPFDTGYEENSHVMRFAALTREVYVTSVPAPVYQMKGPGKTSGTTIKQLGPLILKDPEIAPVKAFRRKVTLSMGGRGAGKNLSEATFDILEEDEPKEDQGDDDEPINPLVDALFDEVEELRMKLFESEMRCAIIEAETREEVMHEMEERMRSMEEMYSRRLMKELEQNELKTDAKIDMLHQSGLFGSPVKQRWAARPPSDVSEEEVGDVEQSLIDYSQEDGSGEEFALSDGELLERTRSQSMSPLAKKGKPQNYMALSSQPAVTQEVRKRVSDQPLLPNTEDAELTETEGAGTGSVAESGTTEDEMDEDDAFDDDDYSDGDDEDEDEYVPPTSTSTHKKSKAGKNATPTNLEPLAPSKETETNKSARAAKGDRTHVAKLARGMNDLSLKGPDESVVILPSKKHRPSGSSNFDDNQDDGDEESHDDEQFELPVLKKKKRQLGTKRVMTEDDIEKTTSAVERNAAKTKNIRRLTGHGQ